MKNQSCSKFTHWTALVVGAAIAFPLSAQSWKDIDFSFNGTVRQDAAYRTTSLENPNNARGNPFNGVAVERRGGLPLLTGSQTVFVDESVRAVPTASNDFNLLLTRAEGSMVARMGHNLSLNVDVRGVYDPLVYQDWDPASIGAEMIGALQGKPRYFEYRVSGDDGSLQSRKTPYPLEWTGRDYMIDLPKAYIDLARGPLFIRAGQQQIAWGQSIFFRVLDVPNGLDLRRHLVLDSAFEEFADKRVPSLGIRAGYQAGAWDLDGFVQHFRPTIFPNPNTSYNVIPQQFTVHDLYGNVDKKLNYGFRASGPLGPVNLQVMAAHRYNPDGAFRWTASNVSTNLPINLPNILPVLPGVLPALNDVANTLIPGGVPATGGIIAQTPLEVESSGTSGVLSADEWFTYAGMVRLDGLEALNTLIREFPASQILGAREADDMEEARRLLDLFFQLSNGLRGHIAREYFREDVFGAGLSYVTQGRPGGWLDQVIINLEFQYTPERTFTALDLSTQFDKRSEWMTSLVMEHYHRFFNEFPATYLVFQWLHKSESDLFGRLLGGYSGDVNNTPRGKSGGYDAFVFAAQQPFPRRIWVLNAAVLWDPSGGLLVQPQVTWTPSGSWTVDLFYNHINGGLRGNRNGNALSTLEFAEELALRIGYQF